MTKKFAGLSLVELLVVLLLCTFIGASLPLMDAWVKKQRFMSAKSVLMALIVEARVTALTRRIPVVLCPQLVGSTCGHDWSKGVTAFGDRNDNGVLDGDDELLAVEDYASAFSTIVWQSFSGSQRMYFHAYQGVNVSNGTMLLCSPDKKLAVKLVLNRAGRLRERAASTDDCPSQ